MKTAFRSAISLAVAFVLLLLLMLWSGVRPRDVWETVGRLPPSAYFASAALHAAVYALRAWRFRILIPPATRPTYARALVVSSAHNLAAYVMPAKTGEASFVVYLKTTAGVPAARGLASLVVSRILDLEVLCAGLCVACAWIACSGDGSDSAETRVAASAIGGLGALSVVLFALAVSFAILGARSHVAVPLAERCARALGVDRLPFGERILARAREVQEALKTAGGDRRLLGATLVSVPLWGLVFVFYAVLARGMGLDGGVGLAEITFGSSVAVMFNLLPVNGIAGFGTQEAGWTFGFALLGIDRELALATGIGTHFVQLFNVCVFGLVAHFFMGAMTAPLGSSHAGPPREQ